MYKTRYKSCLSTTDELQFVQQGDTPPNSYKENAPKEKQANYTFSSVNAVSSGKCIPVSQLRLTGKGVNNHENIWNNQETVDNSLQDGHSSFGVMNRFGKQRQFKKDGIIYDLIY